MNEKRNMVPITYYASFELSMFPGAHEEEKYTQDLENMNKR